MSIFNLRYINELQVNGQTINDNDDFNIDTGADASANAPADTAAADANNQNQEANNNNAEDDDNFTLDDEENNMEDTEDNAENNENQNQEENDDNFTLDDEGQQEEGGEEQPQEGGDNQQQQQPAKQEKDLPKDPVDAIDDDEIRASEEAIYDSLTDDQKRIRILQLKIDYKDLYETITNTIENINDIPKKADNLESVKRLINLLTKAKNILVDYIENNFDSNPYLENYTVYIKYLAIFKTTTKVIEEMNNSK